MVCAPMGLLDEAIREHLELKRRRGADPAEVAREQHEALDPVSDSASSGEVDASSAEHSAEAGVAPEHAAERWAAANAPALERYLAIVADIRAARTYDQTTLSVALREAGKLIERG